MQIRKQHLPLLIAAAGVLVMTTMELRNLYIEHKHDRKVDAKSKAIFAAQAKAYGVLMEEVQAGHYAHDSVAMIEKDFADLVKLYGPESK
jgi:hypothetical protein